MSSKYKDIKHIQSRIIVTKDNSKTLLIPELDETYHSTNGAITESKHIFIKEGLLYSQRKKLNVFEMGFGTGLNAFITYLTSINKNLNIDYSCIECFPLPYSLVKQLNYSSLLKATDLDLDFEKMHLAKSEELLELGNFNFTKYLNAIQEQKLPKNHFDIVYYDAFGPKVQSELWERPLLQKMWDSMKNEGVLVTYCAQGQFKRTLKEIGFHLESIPGPPGKREISRALKLS
jgi:tRNA U34 5-methylaminomethyl-2-thiouridine-forming methyltransferase MnmC